MEQTTKAPLEFHVKGYPFMDQELILPPSVPNIPQAISQEALFALPYISLIVGIDELVPTKAVYALYDPQTTSLCFVHGDGTFIPQQQICFLKTFKNGAAQQTDGDYYVELARRSANHRHMSMNPRFLAECNNAYPTVSTVKSTLTYMGDLRFGSCPALKSCPAIPASEIENFSMPEFFSITAPSQWDFDPGGFQAFTDDNALDAKYLAFSKKYKLNISPLDFQHALFCLVGLDKVGLISFTLVGSNDVRYFKKGLTASLLPKLKTPTKTYRNWTVDCFLARFERYQAMFKSRDGQLLYERFPNPIAWLEAHMDYEVVSGKLLQPGYMKIEEDGYYMDQSVISWEFLKELQWETGGDYSQYPKPLIPLEQHPLHFRAESPEPHSRNESEEKKQDRREKRKAVKKAEKARAKAAASYVIDLTEDGPGQDHMHSSGIRNTGELLNQQRALSQNPLNAESSTATPPITERERDRKRKLAVYQTRAGRPPNRAPISQTFGYSSDEDENEFPILEQLSKQNRPEFKPYPAPQKMKNDVRPSRLPTENDFSILYDQPAIAHPMVKVKFEEQEPRFDIFGNEDELLDKFSDEEGERARKKKERRSKRPRRDYAAEPAPGSYDEFVLPQSLNGGVRKRTSETTFRSERGYYARTKDMAERRFSPTESPEALDGFLGSLPEEEKARYISEVEAEETPMDLMDNNQQATQSSSLKQTREDLANEYQLSSENEESNTRGLRSSFHEDEDDLFSSSTSSQRSTPFESSRSPASRKEEATAEGGSVNMDEYVDYEESLIFYPSSKQESQASLEPDQEVLPECDERNTLSDPEYVTPARRQGSFSRSSATLAHLDSRADSQGQVSAGNEFFSPPRVHRTGSRLNTYEWAPFR